MSPGPSADNVEIVGATPTRRAIDSALAHLLAQSPEPRRSILLITDGAANCDDALMFPDLLEVYDETLLTTVESAYLDEQVTTVVFGVDIVDALQGVGVDGEAEANPHARLNELAVAGGAPKNMGQDPLKFHAASDQGELLDAVSGVLDELASCAVDLTMTEQGPPDPIQVYFTEFAANGMLLPLLDPEECDTMDGWTWIEEGLTLTLCGGACDGFRTGELLIEGVYGCPPPW